MAASIRRLSLGRRDRLINQAALLTLLLCSPFALQAQVVADPVLNGTVRVGDTMLTEGMVTLHHLSADGEGEVDSATVSQDGSFSLRLPSVPDPDRQDVFFVSIEHSGVFYFGNPITLAVQLDSAYTIQAYDTLVAPVSGFPFTLQARNIFFEPEGDLWRVTDLFQLINPQDKTVVSLEGGVTWRYPLMDNVTDFTVSQSDLAPDATSFEDGDVVLRAPVTPGERLVVVRYVTDDVFVTVPTPGTTLAIDLLVREPAPLLDVEGLSFVESTELEEGTTYRHFSGADVSTPSLRVIPAEEPFEPPVEWVAVVLALLLAGAGIAAMKKSPSATIRADMPSSREDLLLAIARLDESFDAADPADAAAAAQYRRSRAELLQRIREAG